MKNISRRYITEQELGDHLETVLSALAALETKNITLGRICPNNFMIDQNEQGFYSVKLKFSLENHHSRNGEELYMPPEVLLGGELTTKGDIWSLGITIYILTTGTFPFCDIE